MSTRPGPGLAPGTRVTVMKDGHVCAGVVAHYEPDLHLTHRTFPVRFTQTGQWRLVSARDVTVVQPDASARSRDPSRRKPNRPATASSRRWRCPQR